MDINNIINTRRSIRKYKPQRIQRKLLKKIVDAARWAPSVHNLQPWRFIVAEGLAKEHLVRALRSRRKNETLPIRLFLKNTIKIIEEAPVAILVYKKNEFSSKFKISGRLHYRIADIMEIQSVASAIQNMLLIAHSLGLGAIWLGVPLYREKEIGNFLRVYNDKLMAILAIGYPDETPLAPSRKSMAKIVSFRK